MLAIFGRYLFPMLLRYLINFTSEKYVKSELERLRDEANQKQGQVVVKKNKDKTYHSKSDNDDDYVDFEEIK